MGYYIQGPDHGKAVHIVREYGGRTVTKVEAETLVATEGVIVVVDNGPFEAAMFAYDMSEFQAAHYNDDKRSKWYVVLPRNKAKELSNYKGD